ncbi:MULTISPECIES: 6-phospho-3-hexuloisomerase [Anaerostipes]|uniref:6-phospho-3-hexuloisomerase n=1 Tax=Anaerostipes TaxID=207244 RepID=UPI00095136E1|nr:MULTISPECIES: 6-phospho-3-hexuloisomerase [Anaerostipes]MCI5623560.1 6-phospho-3-hexuloisomerase [Anaerostipes sp.]MDY2726221.1 6-phospho-3-hexuloisomerase [Anaerostipes faecalis]OLR59916.1 6-phospho 3-hexuloisomerase [Anaerostipes sp. 494a]
MEAKKLKMITDELSKYSGMVKEEEIQALADAVVNAEKIFLAGAGRSGLAARGFTNRLLHMGFDVHFVGEISCPPIKEGDLIILGSGSGTTKSLIVMGEKAKGVGAKIATVTMFPAHTIGQMADVIVTVPGSTPKKAEGEKNLAESVQPMGNLFEQMSWLTYDSIIMTLMDRLGQTSEEMMGRHTNLE